MQERRRGRAGRGRGPGPGERGGLGGAGWGWGRGPRVGGGAGSGRGRGPRAAGGTRVQVSVEAWAGPARSGGGAPGRGRGPQVGAGLALIGPALPFWMPLPPLPPLHWLPCFADPPLPQSGLQHQETVIIFAPVLNAVPVPGLSPLPPYLPHLHLRSPPYLPEPWSLP